MSNVIGIIPYTTNLFISAYTSSENKVIFVMRLIFMLLGERQFGLVIKIQTVARSSKKQIV